MTHATSKSPRAGRLLFATLALAGSAAWAQEPGAAPAAPEPAPAAVEAAAAPEPESVPELSGMVVAIGKDGKLRQPTREEALELLKQKMPSLGKMGKTKVEHLPKGRRRAILGPEHLSYAMVSVGADGQLHDVCSDDPVAVLQILDGGVQEEK